MFGIATLIGGGLNLFGGLSAAKSAKINAQTNYLISLGNAETERGNTLAALDLDSVRSQIELDNARMNMDFALIDAGARTRNAERLRQFSEVRTSQSREAIRRQMKAFDGLASSQRAAIGASGVTGSGSPLEVMAESAGQMQLALRDAQDAAGMERADTLNRAGMEEIGGSRDTLQARAGLMSAERGYSLSAASNALGRMSAESNYRTAKFGASINRLAGLDQAKGMQFSAIGGAFTGLANLGAQRSQAKYLGF